MKKTLCLVLCVALLAVVNPVFFTEEAAACGPYPGESYYEQGYEEYENGNYYCAVKGDEAVLLHYNAHGQDEVILDSTIGPYKLVEIAVNAFETSPVKRVVIPEGVVAIGEAAFEQSAVEEIVLPGSLKYIHGAFTNLRNLESVVFSEGLEETCGTLFYNCEKLKEVTLPSTLKKVHNLFYMCPELENVALPENLETVTGYLFRECDKITSVVLPASIRSMSCAPIVNFEQTETVSVAPGSEYLRVENGCLLTSDDVLLQAMEGFEIPDDVTSIGAYAFYAFKGLQEVTLPAGVTPIGNQAFAACPELVSIAAVAPSSSQIFAATLSLVGFCKRV